MTEQAFPDGVRATEKQYSVDDDPEIEGILDALEADVCRLVEPFYDHEADLARIRRAIAHHEASSHPSPEPAAAQPTDINVVGISAHRRRARGHGSHRPGHWPREQWEPWLSLTEGRVRPARILSWNTTITVLSVRRHGTLFPFELEEILQLCDGAHLALTVAELAVCMSLPSTVVQILLCDLEKEGLVTLDGPDAHEVRYDLEIEMLKRILVGLRSLPDRSSTAC